MLVPLAGALKQVVAKSRLRKTTGEFILLFKFNSLFFQKLKILRVSSTPAEWIELTAMQIRIFDELYICVHMTEVFGLITVLTFYQFSFK
jgi:hypothetical protein